MSDTIGFIGLGHMGGPMAINLLKNNHAVIGYDLVADHLTRHEQAGGQISTSIAELAKQCTIIFTMLPQGQQVQSVCVDQDGLFMNAKPGTLFIDCSSIDIATTRLLAEQAKHYQCTMLDAPVSGGMTGAEAGTLTFMVGGNENDFTRAQPILSCMGKNIFYTGTNSTGQATKICNNMLLAISMIGVAEAFNLAESLGLNAQTFFDVASVSSGQCWSLTHYCPVKGPVPTSPANKDYQPGFTNAMMLKDLKLSQQAAQQSNTTTLLGAQATALYELLNQSGLSQKDFSSVITFLRGTVKK